MTWADLDSYARPVLDVFALIGAWIAVVTFRRNVKIKRAEWLSSLHSKFFEAAENLTALQTALAKRKGRVLI
jgi:thiol:disulfide interchange protein